MQTRWGYKQVGGCKLKKDACQMDAVMKIDDAN